MEDFDGARIGDQVAGTSETDVHTAITGIAKLHATMLAVILFYFFTWMEVMGLVILLIIP